MHVFDLLCSTSGFSRLFLMSIFLLRSLGDGKGLPGSSYRKTEKAELVTGCASPFSIPARMIRGLWIIPLMSTRWQSAQFYDFLPQSQLAHHIQLCLRLLWQTWPPHHLQGMQSCPTFPHWAGSDLRWCRGRNSCPNSGFTLFKYLVKCQESLWSLRSELTFPTTRSPLVPPSVGWHSKPLCSVWPNLYTWDYSFVGSIRVTRMEWS